MPRFSVGKWVLILAVVLLIAPSSGAVVYLNMIWNEDEEEFDLGTLYVEGQTLTFGRDYQNEYGVVNGLTPGPPFIIEAPVIAMNAYDPDGNVDARGEIKFEGSTNIGGDPFEINFIPAVTGRVYLEAESGVSFIGYTLDPITVQGITDIECGSRGGEDPYESGQHDFTWSHTNFYATFDATRSNAVPLVIKGGNATIESCFFSMSDPNFSYPLIQYDNVVYNTGSDPVWDFTMRNCRFENFEPLRHLVQLGYLRSVTIEDCHFTGIEQRSPNDQTALVEVRECGLKSIRDNTASNNLISSLINVGGWATANAYIETNESLPLVSSSIRVDEDSTLNIEPGSILKFFDYNSGLTVRGTLEADSAVFTSYRDDEYGGNSDNTVQPSPVPAVWNNGYECGILVDSTGTAIIRGGRVRYANGGVAAYNDLTVEDCVIERCNDRGLFLSGRGADLFRVARTTIQHISVSSGTAEPALEFENRSLHGQLLEIDSVTIRNNAGPGIEIGYLGDYPSSVEITNTRVLSNEGFGVQFQVDPSLNSMTIASSMIVGNVGAGVYGMDYQGEDVPVTVTSSLIFGNYGYGVDVRRGTPTITGNTIGYNWGRGINLLYSYSIDQGAVANNIIYRNRLVGFNEGVDGDPLFASNDFWENGDGPVTFRSASGWLYTIAEVQALGGDYATNIEVDPAFVAPVYGEITTYGYVDSTRMSWVTSTGTDFAALQPVDWFICADTTDPRWFNISHVGNDTLYAYGDISEHASVGSVFLLHDYHLVETSPLVELGNGSCTMASYDVEGDARLIDGDKDGYTAADIGADEYNPYAGHVAPITLTSPSGGELFQPGDTCEIRWETDSVTTAHVLLTTDYSLEPIFWDTLAKAIDASSGEFNWEVTEDWSMKCLVRIEDATDPTRNDVSGPLTIKSRWLTRIEPDSVMIPFRSEDDGWRFPNEQDYMWPASWYAQFDYENADDPFTGRPYPFPFYNPLIMNAKPSDFPDWPSFVRAFGVDQCYSSTAAGLEYRLPALTLWRDIKAEWAGSCYGFGVSAGLAFCDSAAFVTQFPGVGTYAALHELDTTGDIRNLVTELFVTQFSQERIDHDAANGNKTPRETLVDVREVMAGNYANAPMLVMGNSGPNGGAHVVTPFCLETDTLTAGKYRVHIYDCNYPKVDALSDDTLFVEIDSSNNSWSYSGLPSGWPGAQGYCYLMDSSASYLRTPTLVASSSGWTPRMSLDGEGDLRVYFHGISGITITDSAGNVGGFDDETAWEEIAGLQSLVMATGGVSNPYGYAAPSAAYDFDLDCSDDTTVSLAIRDGGLIYRYVRFDAEDSHTDQLLYDTGLVVHNPNLLTKEFALEYDYTSGSVDRQCMISGLTISQGESVDFYSGDGDVFHIRNHGAAMNIDLHLWQVSSSGSVIATSEGVNLVAGGLSSIAPNWSDPELSEVNLMIDYEPDGVYDETVVLNIVTDADDTEGSAPLPKQFKLGQNYPNPFNPSTTIRYDLPQRARVSIEVLNILGQHVRTLVDADLPAGGYEVEWDGNDASGNEVASGVYLYRLRAEGFSKTRKMMLLK